MPSPFPGMDPYLEGSTWMNFHGQLCAEIARQLGPKIRPRYLARLIERFFTDISIGAGEGGSGMPRSPDVGIIHASGTPSTGEENLGGTGLAIAPVRVATELVEPVLHFGVEIRDRLHRRLVTSIEVLSPTNKHGKGRREYLAKRRKLLQSSAHLVEIDLLHGGERLPMQAELPLAPYYVYVGRSEIRPETDVWAIPIDRPLPPIPIPIPLLADDPPANLDLQQALSTVYELSDYDREIDYTKPPEVRLPPEEAAWVDDRLRAAGLRS